MHDDYQNGLRTPPRKSRANFYVVQGDAGAMGRDDGLEKLAGVTGAGAVMRVTTTASRRACSPKLQPTGSRRSRRIRRIGRDSRSGWKSRPSKAGVTIHARPAAAVSRVAPGPRLQPPAGQAGLGVPKDMLANQAAYTDLQLRAAAIVQRGTGDKMIVLVQAEPVDPAVKIKAMKVGFFDANNKGGSTRSDAGRDLSDHDLHVRPAGHTGFAWRPPMPTGKSGAVDIKVNTALDDGRSASSSAA